MSFKKIYIVLLPIILFASCAKVTGNKLVGHWSIVSVGQPNVPEDAMWSFYDDGRLEIYKDVNGDPKGELVGEWKPFARNAVIPHFKVKGLGEKGMDGKWRIEKLNKKHLVITRVEFGDGERAGSFLRREFKKQ